MTCKTWTKIPCFLPFLPLPLVSLLFSNDQDFQTKSLSWSVMHSDFNVVWKSASRPGNMQASVEILITNAKLLCAAQLFNFHLCLWRENHFFSFCEQSKNNCASHLEISRQFELRKSNMWQKQWFAAIIELLLWETRDRLLNVAVGAHGTRVSMTTMSRSILFSFVSHKTEHCTLWRQNSENFGLWRKNPVLLRLGANFGVLRKTIIALLCN